MKNGGGWTSVESNWRSGTEFFPGNEKGGSRSAAPFFVMNVLVDQSLRMDTLSA